MPTPHDEVRKHYELRWGLPLAELPPLPGAMASLDPDFAILAWQPSTRRRFWTYATCGMCAGPARPALETHMFVRDRSDAPCVALLTMTVFFHQTREALGLQHTVALGHPWMPGSQLDHAMLSLPYLDRPLEWQTIGRNRVRHLWLLPITRSERELKKSQGGEVLERIFERQKVQFADPMRSSLV